MDSTKENTETRFSQIANKFYPSPKAPQGNTAMTDVSATDEASQKPDDRSLADKMYADGVTKPNGPYSLTLKASLDHLADYNGLSNDEVAQVREKAAKSFFELNMPVDEAGRIFGLVAKNLNHPPDSKTMQEWQVETRKRLREQYGLNGAIERVEAVSRYLESNPWLRDLLEESGSAYHPDIALTLIDKCWSLKRAGRLR